jgi:regulator of replication initiation timing
LAKKLEALEKNMTTKAGMEDILKQLAVVKQENVDLRWENQVLKKELEDNKNITKSYGVMAAKNVSNIQKDNVTY